jgi:hypothetical protein
MRGNPGLPDDDDDAREHRARERHDGGPAGEFPARSGHATYQFVNGLLAGPRGARPAPYNRVCGKRVTRPKASDSQPRVTCNPKPMGNRALSFVSCSLGHAGDLPRHGS